MGKLKGKSKGKSPSPAGKDNAFDKAKELYRDAVDALSSVAGGDWLGPKHSPEKVADALDSTKGINTDGLRKTSKDIADSGRPTSLKEKGLFEKASTALLGVVGGFIADQLLEKAWEWWRSDEKSQEFGKDVSDAADNIDSAQEDAGEQAREMCSKTKDEVDGLAALLAIIDKTEFPAQYQAVLEAADRLINECGSGVIDLASARDDCVCAHYDCLIERGTEICEEPVSELPKACQTTPQCVEPAPAPQCPPASPPPTVGPPAPAPAPPPAPAPTPPPQPAPGTPQAPVPVEPATKECPPEKPAPPAPKECPPEKPDVPAPKKCPPEKPPVTEPVTVEPEKPCEDKDFEIIGEAKPAEDCSSGIVTIIGIGVAIAIIGALITAAEEFLTPPEVPAPEPPPEPTPVEPPPPPKQVVPEPSPVEPPPPPKQGIAAAAPVEAPVAQPVVDTAPVEEAPLEEPPAEPVGSGVARKAGAW
ncbi:hypothetical protein [Corynebacterium sp. H130]|uniref:hypothetical protein n=1 Tax=Corynebacterium sp. H130 TaxID=3133444 RepID=UPI00309F1F9B